MKPLLRKLGMWTHANYYNCAGQHYKPKGNPYIYVWDCRCGIRKYWMVRLIAKLLGDSMTRI